MPDLQLVNQPDIMAEVRHVFLQYESALLTHDVAALNDFFWRSEDTVRYGVAEQCYGFDAICAYRDNATAVDAGRQLRHTVITTFGRNNASVCTEFFVPGTAMLGRQTQSWVRFGNDWKIVAAHVSELPVAP